MKFTSPLPAQLARVLDLVERDVTSNVDVGQETPFPLGQIPGILRQFTIGGTVSLNDSGGNSRTVQTTNGAATDTPIMTLAKGLWDLQIFVSFSATFTPAAPQPQQWIVHLFDTAKSIQSNLASGWGGAANDVQNNNFVRRVLIEVPLELRVTLASSGVGQTISVAVNVIANRLV